LKRYSIVSRRRLIFLAAAHDDLERIVGLCRRNAFASPHGARIQTSCSSSAVRISGMAFGFMGSTTGAVVKNP
jgi:hypothetical protein